MALKEAAEETGIVGLTVRLPAVDVDVHESGPAGEATHLRLDLRFVVLAPPGTAAAGPPPGNHESHEVRWATLADLDRLDVDEGARRLAERGLSLLGP